MSTDIFVARLVSTRAVSPCALELVPLASAAVVAAAFLIYCWLVQHPPGLGAVDEMNFTVLARRILRGLHGGPASFLASTRGPNAPLVPTVAATECLVSSLNQYYWLTVLVSDILFD